MPKTAPAIQIRRLMVANRSEIAIRVFRAASELGIATIAIYAEEDKLSLHRFKADEAYLVGRGPHLEKPLGPLEAYLSVEEVIRVAREAHVDAIHPGYGFLSESPEFADACAENGIIFIGPTPKTMRTLGNKVAARNLAISVDVPVMPATEPLPDDPEVIKHLARKVGYPLMLKASWGGGGRGMRPIESEDTLIESVTMARREAKSAFGKDEVYLEKLVRRARHVEVQLLGDKHGHVYHLFERDCSIQRRNQKVVERAPAPYLDDATRMALCEAAMKIGRATDYVGAGTVEFLMDADTGAFYFIEVNPRIQVEHTVTEQVTGLDIVKAQIKILEGGRLGHVDETGIPKQKDIRLNGHALQCRITTENPDNSFIPDYGRITAYRGAFGFGIRVDGGTAYSGAIVTRYYDPMLEKITAWASSPAEVISRMDRALREYRIRGVATNLNFLEAILAHPKFRANEYTTRFIDETPELFASRKRRDRATKLLTYLADVTVNGHPETKGRVMPPIGALRPAVPLFAPDATARTEGTKALLDRLGPAKFAAWMRDQSRVLVTDTTMRDAHQSLLATRVRTFDIAGIAPAYQAGLPQLLSLECWGGATFDVAMRFLTEDPWERLALVREGAPNILTQMLLRGANGVGYTNYPDNVVRYFVSRAARAGMDIFRIFDCLNWVENMRVSIDAAMDAMSGATSQPTLGSLVEALRHTERDTGLDPEAIRRISFYWEAVRTQYAAFESDLRAGASEVYLHEMPGGQFTNLKEQARALGLGARWHEVARAYRAANDLFGDIIKVTPSSKVVGDMALMMVAQDITPDEVLDPRKDIAFPASVVEMLRGDLGQPPGGWPAALQAKVLKGTQPSVARPGSLLPEANLATERSDVEKRVGRHIDDDELASSLMYPKVFAEFCTATRKYGPVSTLPTPIYFYGMNIGDEATISIERGKTLIVRLQTISETDEDGDVKVFFELNGQPRVVNVPNRSATAKRLARRKAEDGNDAHIAAPMPGLISSVAVQTGQAVKTGDLILTIEAMKMETALHAPRDGTVSEMLVKPGSLIDAKDLLAVLDG